MVFYIIAFADKKAGEEAAKQRVHQRFPDQGGREANQLHDVKIDKTQFKLGSLDQLMALNETSAKLDLRLDAICKKIERIALDTGRGKLMFKNRDQEIEYLDYIKSFEWKELIYSKKKSLAELCALITKNMRSRDEQVKKAQDEMNKVKSEYQALVKKEGGNLMARDFTDDVYNLKTVNEGHFVEEGSEMFCNMLVVVPKTKMAEFERDHNQYVANYLSSVDQQEDKRVADSAKAKFTELREKQGEEWVQLVGTITEGQQVELDEAFAEKARAYIARGLEAEIKEKRKHRIPSTIVPGAIRELPGIDARDRDNTVVRIVCYRPQADDIVKAMRKQGFTARPFSYNRAKWEDEKKRKQALNESLTNKTAKLNQTACECYQDLFTALMHLKIMRVFIDGVLRFGIPPKFYIGMVLPRRGEERKILQSMSDHLAEEQFRDMYGEKVDASEADDYWPFSCVPLTSPNFMHTNQ